MSETSASVSSSKENIYISSSSSSSERVPTSESEVGTSNPQLPLPSTSHPFQPSTSQPLPPSSSQPSHSLSKKNALEDVKDQADDKVNPKPWYTADEKSGKMSTEDLHNLILKYPIPEANYGTKFEMGVYEEQVKSGYRLPLHPFALRFFKHYSMAPGQLVPNGWRKLAGLIYLVQTSGYKPDATDFLRVFFEICFVKGVANYPGWYYIHSGLCINEPLLEEQLEWAKIIPPRPIPAGLLIPSPPRVIPSVTSAETVPLVDGSNLHSRCKLADEMLSRFEMARQVEAEEAQQKREALSKQEADHLAQIVTLEKRPERVKRKAAEEVTKVGDQGIRDFLDGNTGDEWLKKRTDDGLEIYELGFAKAKEMFAERFPDIPSGDFVLPVIVSPSGETVMPSEAGDAAAYHLPGEGPSGDAPEP
ncbi:hypothetical protein RJ639_011516 [Escallonia herrerae]|uniref:Transposase (putative) gypsy type domain-containing protein n=1 Tax=Escallonia herrerae TaxID=1293975 RepID=A0AA89AQ17_9ASTE|nr:hypothetical protein RJ639_011516 [Escallonia herrerae]